MTDPSRGSCLTGGISGRAGAGVGRGLEWGAFVGTANQGSAWSIIAHGHLDNMPHYMRVLLWDVDPKGTTF